MRQRAFRHLLSAGALLALAGCGLADSEPPVAPSSFKLKVAASATLPAGARLLADYGDYRLVEADAAAAAQLSTLDGTESRDDEDRILLNAGAIDTRANPPTTVDAATASLSGRRLRLVQFVGPILPEWHDALEKSGVRVVTYIPNNTYLVYAEPSRLAATSTLPKLQWQGAYLDRYKLQPELSTVATDEYIVQLVSDPDANEATLDLVRSMALAEPMVRGVADYVNVVASLPPEALDAIAARPDVVSVAPRPPRRKFDERQNIIMSGQIDAQNAPTGPGYLAWLTARGFTQAQFTASGFGVDVTDSGLDNGTSTPNHFGFYVGGSVLSSSRVVYNRLEGRANYGSSLAGCDGHGTINGHIIGGYNNRTASPHTDSSGFNYGLGVAPFVKLGSSVIFDPNTFTNPDYTNLQSRAYRDGMRVSCNSWGAEDNPAYDAEAQEYDYLVRDAQPSGAAISAAGNQEMVVVFAAGNEGPYTGTVSSPATAKNVIAVGASENVHPFNRTDGCETPDSDANSAMDVAEFSSRGPCSDNRKKPDLLAPGTHISGGLAQSNSQRSEPPASATGQALACFDSNAEGVCGILTGSWSSSPYYPIGQQWWTVSTGTSHSAPAVAGAAALVRQYFVNQTWTPPSPAMTKAFLMNAARYMNGRYASDTLPSNVQGMGLIDLGKTFDGMSRLLRDQLPADLFTSSGQTRTFTGAVGDSTRPFIVTLAWTDAPGPTFGSAWKNNLDLRVTIGGGTYLGNVFSGSRSITGGSADTMNNVETVSLPAGVTGDYTITVTATNVNSDGVPNNGTSLDQDFALVVYNSCDTAAPVPVGVTATASGNNRIDISWTANGATDYTVYRGTTPGGPYTAVATVTAPFLTDTGVSGGTRYYYVVRGRACAESAASAEVSALATGVCNVRPDFAGVVSAGAAGLSVCTNTISWAAATARCGGTLSYSVYRGTTASFVPSVSNRLEYGIPGLTYEDGFNLVSGTTYYYVVRATETAAQAFEETNAVTVAVTASGAITSGIRYFDDFDSNRPAAAASYWTVGGTGASAALVVSGCKWQSATRAYRIGASAATTCPGEYAQSVATDLVLGGNGSTPGVNGFSISASASAPKLSFSIWYDLETNSSANTGYDGVYLAYSTSSAYGPWLVVPDYVSTGYPNIESGGYNTTLSGTSTRVWTGSSGGSNGAFKSVSVNLNAMRGSTVWFAFRFSSDYSVNREGFYVDDVRLVTDNVVACTTETSPAGPAVAYEITGLPALVIGGSSLNFDVRAVDANRRTATSYSGSAVFTSTDPAATLPAAANFSAGRASGRTVTLRTAGAQEIIATDTSNASITGRASTTVSAARKLAFTVQPTSVFAGGAISVTVAVQDALGAVVTSPNVDIALAIVSGPAGGSLGGTVTRTTTSGITTFTGLALDRAGSYVIGATTAGLTAAQSAPIAVAAGPTATLAFNPQPASAAAGALLAAFDVEFRDAYGNLTPWAASVTLALSGPSGASLAGTTTIPASGGIARFSDLSIARAGLGYRLIAMASGLPNATSAAFDILGGEATQLVFAVQPSATQSGLAITPAVKLAVQDGFGNLATSATQTIAIALSNPGALSGTLEKSPTEGVAVFDDLVVRVSGNGYVLRATVPGLADATSTPFDVTQGTPSRLVFVEQPPARATAGVDFSVVVALGDAAGNPILELPGTVTLTLGPTPEGGELLGTRSRPLDQGLARFDGLSLRQAGSGYELIASIDSLSIGSAASAPFEVVAAQAQRFVAELPMQVVKGEAVALTARAVDEFGNQAPDYSGRAAITSTDAQAQLPGEGLFSEGRLVGDVGVVFGTLGAVEVTLADASDATITGTANATVLSDASPIVEIVSPGAGGVFGMVEIVAEATLPRGVTVSEVEIFVDGEMIATGAEQSLSVSWDTSSVALRSAHQITAQLTDSRGMSATSAPVSVVIVDGKTVYRSDGCGCGAATGGVQWVMAVVIGGAALMRRRRQGRGQVG